MALNIKDPETDRLARDLASRMGTSITEALKVALQERLRRTSPPNDRTYDEIVAIGERGRARALIDTRAEAEILGYDDDGLPG